jgi:hypothetical protein
LYTIPAAAWQAWALIALVSDFGGCEQDCALEEACWRGAILPAFGTVLFNELGFRLYLYARILQEFHERLITLLMLT